MVTLFSSCQFKYKHAKHTVGQQVKHGLAAKTGQSSASLKARMISGKDINTVFSFYPSFKHLLNYLLRNILLSFFLTPYLFPPITLFIPFSFHLFNRTFQFFPTPVPFFHIIYLLFSHNLIIINTTVYFLRGSHFLAYDH